MLIGDLQESFGIFPLTKTQSIYMYSLTPYLIIIY